jgi:hypothetical protein
LISLNISSWGELFNYYVDHENDTNSVSLVHGLCVVAKVLVDVPCCYDTCGNCTPSCNSFFTILGHSNNLLLLCCCSSTFDDSISDTTKRKLFSNNNMKSFDSGVFTYRNTIQCKTMDVNVMYRWLNYWILALGQRDKIIIFAPLPTT